MMEDIDDKTLISLVKLAKGIWVTRDTKTKRNTHILSQLWQGIANTMGVNKTDVQKRWKSLVRRMKIEIQLIPSRFSDSDIDDYQESEFEHFEDMRFLIPGLQTTIKNEAKARKATEGNIVPALKRTAAAPNKNQVVELNLRNESPNRTNKSEDEAKTDRCKQFLNSLVFHAVDIPAEKILPCQIKIFQAISEYKPDISDLVKGLKEIESKSSNNDSLIDVIDLENETFENVSHNSLNRNQMKYERVPKISKREKSQSSTVNNYEQLPSIKAQHQSNQAMNLQNENINIPQAPYLFTYLVTPLIPHSASPISYPFVENNRFYPGQLLPSNNAVTQLHMAQQQMQLMNNSAVLQQLQSQHALYSNQNPYCTYQPVNIGLHPYHNAFIPQAATASQQLIDCDRMQFSVFAQQQHCQQSDLSDYNFNQNQNSSIQVQAQKQQSSQLHATSVIQNNAHNGGTQSQVTILTRKQINSIGQREVNVNNETSGQDDDMGMADISFANQLGSNEQEEDSSFDDMGQQENLLQ